MRKIYLILVVIILVHLLILFKLQFTAWPEMLSFPYMVNKGFVIYKDFHHAYQPLLTIILAFVYKIFGERLLTLEIFTWATILISDVFIYLISIELFGKKLLSLLPVVVFVMIQPFFEGNMLWFDLATVPFILLSVYFLFKKNLFWSGLFIAIAMLIKQQIVLLLAAYFVYFLIKRINFKSFVYFAIGGMIPIGITLAILFSRGLISDYLFWTFLLPIKYLPHIPGYATWPTFKQMLPLIFMLVPLFFIPRKTNRAEIVFFVILLVTSFLAALPRFSYFHLQPMFAIYSILFGIVAVSGKRLFLILVPFAVFIFMFSRNLNMFDIKARFYDDNAISFADLVKKDVSENEKVYFLGENSIVYVLSDRVPPKPWIENYVWHFEIPGMQQKLIDGWQKDPPSVIFWTDPIPGNWYDIGTYQPKMISDYIMKNYIKTKEVEKGVWEWVKK